MTIKKYGHACLLIEKDGVKVLIDPGSWNETPADEGVSALLVTHEHHDHCDPAQVKKIVEKNPGIRVISHAAVAEMLGKEDIAVEAIEPGQPIDVRGVSIESFGTEHAAIYKTSPCRNTGFLIGGELFVPGDAVYDVPDKPVRVLALPTAGPWMKIAEAIDYVKAINPKIAFPIHDALYIEPVQRSFSRLAGSFLEGVEYRDLPAGATIEV